MKRPFYFRLLRWFAIVLLVMVVFKFFQKANQPPFGRIQLENPIQKGAIDPQLVVHQNLVVFLSPERELFAWGGISDLSSRFETWTGFSKPSLVPIPISHDYSITKIIAYDGRILSLLDDGSIRVFGGRVVRNNQRESEVL